MPECKWCVSFENKTIYDGPGNPDTKFSCKNPKGLKDPAPNDSCNYWELDEIAATTHDQVAADEYQQQEAIIRGDA